MPDVSVILDGLVKQYAPFVTTLVVLIIADLLAGVGSALKTNTFQWQKIASFYRTTVIPSLLGWVSMTVLTSMASPVLLGDDGARVLTGVSGYGGFSMVAISLVGSITKSLSEITKPIAPAEPTPSI